MSPVPFSIVCLTIGLVGLGLFLRERRRSATLAATGNQLETDLSDILTNLSSGLMIVDRHGLIERVNPAGRRILGIGTEARGRTLNDVLDVGHFEFTRSVAHVLTGGDRIQRREIEIRADGVALPVGVSVNPLGGDEDVQGAVALFQDLTEVKRLRRQKRESDRLAALGQLSAGIAHEIRNPLGSIRGCAEMLASDQISRDRDERLLNLILKESGRVNRIITDFLAFARSPKAQQKLIALADLMEEVAMICRIDASGSGKGAGRVEVDVVPKDMLLYADEEQIKQVLINLCQNARDASGPEGHVRMEAELDVAGKVARLRVRDDGPGVPPDRQAEVFEPFQTTKPAGTGLGLAIVRRIVTAHDGEISVGTDRSGGAVFTAELPLGENVRARSGDFLEDVLDSLEQAPANGA